MENPPAYEHLESDFAWEKTWAEEDARRRAGRPVLYHTSRALQAIPKRLFKRDKLMTWVHHYFAPGPVLDVGCAGGHTLLKLPPQYVPFGIEVSKELARVAGERFAARGGEVIQGDALSAMPKFQPGFFTGIIMTSYLEHEVDPHSALVAAARLMRPGSRLIIKVPNYESWNRSVRGARWCGFRYPDHVNYFTPALLRGLVEAAGLRVARFGFSDRLPTSDNMWLLASQG
ncbi:MAG: class I SAM-dependent methyltransferase [Terriglobales bacterium]